MANHEDSNLDPAGALADIAIGTWPDTFWFAAISSGLCSMLVIAVLIWAAFDPLAPAPDGPEGLILVTPLALAAVFGGIVLMEAALHWSELRRWERIVAAVVVPLALFNAWILFTH